MYRETSMMGEANIMNEELLSKFVEHIEYLLYTFRGMIGRKFVVSYQSVPYE
jgi:hypothetical protein